METFYESGSFGTKDNMVSQGKNVKVTYHCHVKLEEIPSEVNKLWECNLTIDKITWDSMNGMWRIDYFEIVLK